MYIKPLVRYWTLFITSFTFLFLNVFEYLYITKYDPIIIIVINGLLLHFFVRCPKCRHSIGHHRYGFVNTTFSKYCQRCGQDLMKCEIESDEEIDRRKKEEISS